MQAELTSKTAIAEDAEAINTLVNSVYRGDNARKGWTSEADMLDGIRIDIPSVAKLINENNSVFLLVEAGDNLIGCVHLEKKGNKCHLGMLSVDVNYQNKGIGKTLMDKSEEYAKKSFGCGEMEMKVIGQRKELIDYYLRRGYTITGEREPFILNTHFGKPMIDNLYFEYMVKRLD